MIRYDTTSLSTALRSAMLRYRLTSQCTFVPASVNLVSIDYATSRLLTHFPIDCCCNFRIGYRTSWTRESIYRQDDTVAPHTYSTLRCTLLQLTAAADAPRSCACLHLQRHVPTRGHGCRGRLPHASGEVAGALGGRINCRVFSSGCCTHKWCSFGCKAT